MKTLVEPAHDPTPHINGHDGCHARLSAYGMCPGVFTAEWLNSLGDDSQPFGRTGHTNGQVRENWIKGSNHIKEVIK